MEGYVQCCGESSVPGEEAVPHAMNQEHNDFLWRQPILDDQSHSILQAFGRLDTVSKELQWWDAGPRGFCGELVFVPGEEEDRECSGFLLGMVFYAHLQRSALVVR